MSFKDLSQQKAVANQLQRSLRNGRLAHAYLFAGPLSSGKEPMARTLAKALNCDEKKNDCCDQCDSCRRIDQNSHPDVYWLRPESKSRRLTIAQIRDFEKAVSLKASIAQVKVGVVVDADCMGEEASNAFLKTLEEPPAQTMILLLSAEPQRLLPTILSRCLKISFGPSVGLAGSPYRGKVLALLSKFSNVGEEKVTGSYRLLTGITGILQEIREDTQRRIEAEADLDRYEELDPKVRERLEEQVAARIEGDYRAEREKVLEELYGWFADLLLCIEGAPEQLLEHRDSLSALQRGATGLTYARACTNLDAIEQIRESLTRNISEMLAFEVGLLKLASNSSQRAR